MPRLFHLLALLAVFAPRLLSAEAVRPNILFVFADDWGRHASAYSALAPGGVNDLVSTPNFDRVAREGVLFRNAHVNAPSCTPCRSSLLSGQYFWRTGRGAILQGAVWDASIPTFPLLLRDAGYHIGKTHKVWSPGTPADAPFGGQAHAYEKGGGQFNNFSETVTKLVAGGKPLEEAKESMRAQVRANFAAFLAAREKGRPFFYWFGPTNTHREWVRGSGKALWGLDPEKLKGKMPPFLPDVSEVREDLADYFGEIMALDSFLGVLREELAKTGEADRTLLVVSGDHGAPGFPQGKCNLYDFGTGVSLAISGFGVNGGRVVDDFVNLPDLAPTFLEAAGLPVPTVMTGRSLWPVLKSEKNGQVDASRTWVVTGRERHVENARADFAPYPQRAIRTATHSLIINFHPERWPLGDPYGLETGATPSPELLAHNTRTTVPDVDASPTKAWIVAGRNTPEGRALFDRAFGKRPRVELYDLAADPHETRNLADEPAFAAVRADLEKRLLAELERSGDPRLRDGGSYFENPPLSGPLPGKAKARP